MAVQDIASGLYASAQGAADRVVSPSTRKQYYDNISTFAHEQPLLFSFTLTHLALSSIPLFLFLSFSLGTLALSLLTAAIFSLFWIGVALLVLIPTLFITVSLGLAVWIWAISSFFIARWIYNAVPINVKGKTEIGVPNGKKVVVEKTS